LELALSLKVGEGVYTRLAVQLNSFYKWASTANGCCN